MKEITNEQKLYVLLYEISDKTEEELSIWNIIRKRCSKDSSWFVEVAKNLNRDSYVSYSYELKGDSHWVATELGRQQIPILWNGSELKRRYDEERRKEIEGSKFKNKHGNMAEIIKLILAACIGALINRLADLLFGK